MTPSHPLTPLDAADHDPGAMRDDLAVFHWPDVGVAGEELASAVTSLPERITAIAFVGGVSSADPGLAAVLETFDTTDADAVVTPGPVTEAVKQVEGDRILAGVDRASLVEARLPEVVRRDALSRVLATDRTDPLIRRPSEVLASAAALVTFRSDGVDPA